MQSVVIVQSSLYKNSLSLFVGMPLCFLFWYVLLIVLVFTSYTCRFDVAKLMGIDPDKNHAVLDAVLSELPYDTDWSDDIPLERGYKVAKLKRYHILAQQFQQHQDIQGEKEHLSSAAERGDAKMLPDAESSSSATIKIENPKLLELQSELKILDSATVKLQQMSNQFIKLKAQLEVKAGKHGSFV